MSTHRKHEPEKDSAALAKAKAIASLVRFLHGGMLTDFIGPIRDKGLTFEHYLFLNALAVAKYLSLGEVSKCRRFSTAAATTSTDRLESLGFVRRLHGSDDRRKVYVQITKKGVSLLQEIEDEMKHWVVEMLADGNKFLREFELSAIGDEVAVAS